MRLEARRERRPTELDPACTHHEPPSRPPPHTHSHHGAGGSHRGPVCVRARPVVPLCANRRISALTAPRRPCAHPMPPPHKRRQRLVVGGAYSGCLGWCRQHAAETGEGEAEGDGTGTARLDSNPVRVGSGCLQTPVRQPHATNWPSGGAECAARQSRGHLPDPASGDLWLRQ